MAKPSQAQRRQKRIELLSKRKIILTSKLTFLQKALADTEAELETLRSFPLATV